MDQRNLSIAESLVMKAIEGGGGVVSISALERNPELIPELGRGGYAEDLVYAMQSRELVSYDRENGEVKKHGISWVRAAVLKSIYDSGGTTSLNALERDPAVVRHLGYGVETVDVIYAMVSEGFVVYYPDSGEVRTS